MFSIRHRLMLRRRPAGACPRRGAAAVEFAAVAAPLFLFIFASVEFNRALMAIHCLEEASRSGCRVAILQGESLEDVRSAVAEVLQPAGISSYTIELLPERPATADRWSPITVTVRASYDELTWLPLPRSLGGKTYLATCTLPKEYARGSE